jgi:hypothetical protein
MPARSVGRAALLLMVGVALGYGYWAAATYVLGFAAAQPIPAWWLGARSHTLLAFYSWDLVFYTLMLALLSLPFAYLIARLFGLYWLVAALAISASFAIGTELDMSAGFPLITLRFRIFLLASTLRIACVLPLLTWAMRGSFSAPTSGRGTAGR